jgi:hypothetical protein
MHNYKLSICLPAIRTHLWENFYQSIVSSVGEHSWQLIMVGPNDPPPFFNDKTNFKYIKDYGSPSRCGLIAASIAEGELMMWGSDDGIFTNNSIAACIEKPMHHDYWMAHHHPTLRVVPEHYKILMVGMFKLEYFRELGGWDCRFEHLNMNTHDLSFRLQNDGGKIYESDMYVCNHDWNPNQGDHIPVQQAYEQNDLALFQQIYKEPNSYLERPIKIDYFNWNKSPTIWRRRFG